MQLIFTIAHLNQSSSSTARHGPSRNTLLIVDIAHHILECHDALSWPTSALVAVLSEICNLANVTKILILAASDRDLVVAKT